MARREWGVGGRAFSSRFLFATSSTRESLFTGYGHRGGRYFGLSRSLLSAKKASRVTGMTVAVSRGESSSSQTLKISK